MRFLNSLEQAKWHIRTLKKLIALLFAVIALLVIGWMHSQSKIRVVVPRHIPVSGLTLTQGKVAKSTAYSFAFYVWQSLNHWPNDGMQDYKANIKKFAPLLTPEFKRALIENYNNLLSQGELQDRIRTMQGMAGSNYSPSDVHYLGHGNWEVDLKLRLTERMNGNAKIVKDVQINYPLKVVPYNVDANSNPWGLALAGFTKSPTRIKTFV